MTVRRMCAVGQVNRAAFYRFDRTESRPTRIWICGTRSSALLWSFPAMAGRGSPPS